MPILAALAVATAAGGWARPAMGWGRLGHRASAILAESRLNAEARATIRELLEPGESLADASTWADEVRRFRPKSGPWHYVNVPVGENRYDGKYCQSGGCVVEKVEEFRKVLADPTQPTVRRREALRFLVHLVQDLHQPLHVGNRGDRGGNDLQVRFLGAGSNLHRVWDSGLLDRSYSDERALARDLAVLASSPDAHSWLSGTAEDWANESLRLARLAYTSTETGAPLQPGDRIGLEYVRTHLDSARTRISQSGVRLATILNGCLTSEQAGTRPHTEENRSGDADGRR